MYKSLLFSAIIVLGSLSNAFGVISISVTFTPTLNGGTDANGIVGSNWTFTYNITDTVYSDYFGGAAVLSDSASVTISGVTNPDYNGIFEITETTDTNLLFWPNYGGAGTAYLSHSPSGGSDSTFTIDDGTNSFTVVNFGLVGPSSASATIGGPVEAAHFEGLTVSDGGATTGGTTYGFNNGVTSIVPEPSSISLLLIAFVAPVIMRRKRDID